MAGIVSFSSSIQTPAIHSIAARYDSSRLLTTFAASSAYLLGFGSGPFLFSPVSEILGRRKVYCGTFLIFTLAQMACALSPNIAAFAVFRFVAGFCGGPTVANAGGSITDLWVPSERSAPLAIYVVACYCGPVLGPLIGGVLTQYGGTAQYGGWRWNFWLVLILSAATYVLMVTSLPETYAGSRKATSIEKEGGSKRSLRSDFARPWKMLATEPILLALSTQMAFTYGVLFLDFTSYPVIFTQHRHWSVATSGLSFLGIGLGMLIATALSPLLDRQYSRLLLEHGKLEPEVRLRHLILIAWLLPASLFWFAWTALTTHYIVPILSGVPFGLCLVLLFLGINTYLTDCYAHYSASALAANTMLRSLVNNSNKNNPAWQQLTSSQFGAAFALFATQLYDGLGAAWATSLLGFVALALAPVPWVFYKWGPWLRERSQFHKDTVNVDK